MQNWQFGLVSCLVKLLARPDWKSTNEQIHIVDLDKPTFWSRWIFILFLHLEIKAHLVTVLAHIEDLHCNCLGCSFKGKPMFCLHSYPFIENPTIIQSYHIDPHCTMGVLQILTLLSSSWLFSSCDQLSVEFHTLMSIGVYGSCFMESSCCQVGST